MRSGGAAQAPARSLTSARDPRQGPLHVPRAPGRAATLSGIPIEVWCYRLGNRSAIDWVLDQHKEKTPKDPTIREKFNTYRFADYKEHVVDLLARVVAVSLETVAITDAMSAMRPLRAMRDRVQRRPRP